MSSNGGTRPVRTSSRNAGMYKSAVEFAFFVVNHQLLELKSTYKVNNDFSVYDNHNVIQNYGEYFGQVFLGRFFDGLAFFEVTISLVYFFISERDTEGKSRIQPSLGPTRIALRMNHTTRRTTTLLGQSTTSAVHKSKTRLENITGSHKSTRSKTNPTSTALNRSTSYRML
jgi:hypothetical protein